MKLLLLFILTVLSMAYFVVATAHTGRQTADGMPKDYYEHSSRPTRENCKAIMCNGDTIDFYAASRTRCDELYKNLHFIGRGKFLRTGEELNFYNPNNKNRFVTVQQLEQYYGQKVFFTDVYNCN